MMPRRLPFNAPWPWCCALVCAAGISLGVGRYFSLLPTAHSPLPTIPAVPLDQEQREFLWQVEHHGLLLSRTGFRAVADALVRADQVALRELLAPDFAGEVVREPKE